MLPEVPPPPFVSVVIATFNRRALLLENIESVLAQDYPSFEVIYVDDASGDGTVDFLKECASKDSRLRYVAVPHGGMGLARNAGVAAAKGMFILFSDDDVVVLPDWVAQMVALRERHGCDALSGGFTPYSMDTPVERYLHYRTAILFGSKTKLVTAAPMMSFLLPKSLFEEVGGFQAAPTEDWVFCRALARLGKSIVYDPSVKAVHHYQAEWAPAAHRIRVPAIGGLYDQLDRGQPGYVYMAYSLAKFLTSPVWSLWRYPLDLYVMSLRIESIFFFARLKAYALTFLNRRLPTPH